MLNIWWNAQNPNDFLCHTLSSFFFLHHPYHWGLPIYCQRYTCVFLVMSVQFIWSASGDQELKSQNTVKILKFRTPKKIWCNHPKSWTRWLFLRIMHPKDAAGIANSVGAVWSGSALFAQTCLSVNLGTLLYVSALLSLTEVYEFKSLHLYISD